VGSDATEGLTVLVPHVAPALLLWGHNSVNEVKGMEIDYDNENRFCFISEIDTA
jgi:hypothetical protein